MDEIYYILFRHKWKIVVCSLLGLAGAVAAYLLSTPSFHSEARLFVRFVISDSASVGPADDAVTKSPDQRGETIMNSEVQILTSMDLARKVAETIGPERILGPTEGTPSINIAADQIRSGLAVQTPARSSVIRVGFTHSNREIVQPVLREVVQQYLQMHLSVHRSAGMVDEFLTQETDLLRTRLAQTEEELRRANAKAGVISLESAKASLAEQVARLRQEIFRAEAELAERNAVLQALRNAAPDPAPGTTRAPQPLSSEQLSEYRRLNERLALLASQEQQLLAQFTPENPRVQDLRTQIRSAQTAKLDFEQRHPEVLRAATANHNFTPTADARVNLELEVAQIAALQTRIKILNEQLSQLRSEAATIDQMEVSILELRRRKELEEANYRRYAASLENARIHEALGTGKVSNISVIQTPSAPAADRSKILKLLGALAVGGVGAGLAWALLIEFYTDRSIRRPTDVERHLQVPLLLSMPLLARRERKKLVPRDKKGDQAENTVARAALRSSPLLPFNQALSDRLIASFESLNLTHKPKLVAVTGLGNGVGASTIAAGLSQALSETGEGNVLLVDMAQGPGAAQQFAQGAPVTGLDEMLDQREPASVHEKLFVVSENDKSERLLRNLPQRFVKLVPKLKASDFDYIIFDLPPVGQLSITPRLAAYMDMVLVVVESEKTDHGLAQKAINLLSPSKTHVAVVLNKTRQYIPSFLHQDI